MRLMRDGIPAAVVPVLAGELGVTQEKLLHHLHPPASTVYGSAYSGCGRYMLGGFSDGITNLHVKTRFPVDAAHFGGPAGLVYGTQKRARTN